MDGTCNYVQAGIVTDGRVSGGSWTVLEILIDKALFETQDSNLNPNPFCPKCRLQEFNPNPNPFHFFLDTRI